MARSAVLGLNHNQQLIAGALVIAIILLLTTTVVVGMNGKDALKFGSSSEVPPTVPVATPTPFIPIAETVFSTITGFVPQVVTVRKGAEVNILNFSDNELNVVSADGDSTMNLGEVEKDDEVVVKLNEAGTYNYKNKYRPEETGQIVVVE